MNDFHPDLFLDRLHSANVGEVQIWPLDVGCAAGGFILVVGLGTPTGTGHGDLFRLRRFGAGSVEFLLQGRVLAGGIQGQGPLIAGAGGVEISLAGVQARQEQMRRGKVRVQGNERLGADDRFARLAAQMENAGYADPGIRPIGIDALDALEDGPRLVERPFIKTGVGKEEQKRDVVRRNGDGLAERV